MSDNHASELSSKMSYVHPMILYARSFALLNQHYYIHRDKKVETGLETLFLLAEADLRLND